MVRQVYGHYIMYKYNMHKQSGIEKGGFDRFILVLRGTLHIAVVDGNR